MMASDGPSEAPWLRLLCLFPLRYALRIPDSGRTLIDGEPYALAIHNNRDNPTAFGRCVPSLLTDGVRT